MAPLLTAAAAAAVIEAAAAAAAVAAEVFAAAAAVALQGLLSAVPQPPAPSFSGDPIMRRDTFHFVDIGQNFRRTRAVFLLESMLD